MNPPKIIAHRGASGDVPENTLPAFEEAWNQGADGIECDVQCSADGVVVVMHDSDGRRTLGDSRRIESIAFDELSTRDAGSWKDTRWHHARVPDLRSVLEGVPEGKEAVVELKAGAHLAPTVAAALHEFPNTEITLIAFDFDLICQAKQLAPERRALWLFGGLRQSPMAGASLGRTLVQKVIAGGLDGIDLGWHATLTPELTAPIRDAGLTIYAFTINELPQLDSCMAANVDAVTTDFPKRIRKWTQPQDPREA